MTSNEGIYGPESLRLKGKTVDELPIREARLTLDQLPMVNAADRKNQAEDIIAKYPQQKVEWIDGAIRECRGNMVNVRALREDTNRQIGEYLGIISLCKHRDKQLQAAKTEEEEKAIKAQFPPYNVKAMKTQIGQFRATINRCDEVIDKEQDSIQQLTELRTKCVERDQKLAALGHDRPQ